MKLRTRLDFPRGLAPLALAVALTAIAAGGFSLAAPPAPPDTQADAGAGGRARARAPADATESNITRLTTSLLEQSQFAHHPFDTELAGAFLDRYLDSLDASRSVFLQADVDDFGRYRATLAQVTRATGDMQAAQAVFERYLQRLQQRVAYVSGRLRSAKFDFTGHDVYSYDREHASRPRDLAAAEELWWQELRAEVLQEKLRDKQPEQIVETLDHRYAQQLETMKSLRSNELLEVYLNALAHVYDPHSDYLGHEEMESLSIAMKLSLSGIGATLETGDGYCKVRELVPGGPAARSGLLKPGDRIVSVAQAGKKPVDIVNMPLSRAVELIRGPRGTTVTLSVIPAGAAEGTPSKTATIVRDNVKLEDQEAKARILDVPDADGAPLRLGVVDLPSFYADIGAHHGDKGRSATADVARLLTKLKAEHVRGVIVDLRHNGGGSLGEAISLAGLFIRTGPVVQTRNQDGTIDVDADTDPAVVYDGPLVVLTSRFSASASEIVAGALQDYGRAVLVGDSATFGKGTVQSVLPLGPLMDDAHLAHGSDPGALKITTSKFYRPSGGSTQLRGVASDIVLPSMTDFRDFSESALKDPLPWDTVPLRAHEELDRVAPYVNALRQRSVLRVAAKKDFAYLADDIARLKKRLTTKSVSLNEAARREELAQDRARRKARAEEGRAIHATSYTSYEITLKNASSRGLPPPATVPKPASSAPATDDIEDTTADRADDDIVLKEALRILGDYVGLLSAHPEATGR